MKNVSRGRFGEKRAKALYDAARLSVGVRAGHYGIVFEISHILSMIEVSSCFINEVERKMSPYLEQIPYSKSIFSIKGIGVVIASGLISEVGDFSQFNSIDEIMKLSGLDLFEISSGQHKGKRRISKRGRPLLRTFLFFAAVSVVRKGGIMHDVYNRMLQRGMPKMKALIAIDRKLVGVIFALVRDNKEYIVDYYPQQYLKKAV